MPTADGPRESRSSPSNDAPEISGRFVSLGWKLTVATLLVLATVSAVLFVQLTGRERQSLVAGKRTARAMVADLVAAGLAAPLDFGDADAVDAELQNLRSNRDLLFASVWQKNGASPMGAISTLFCSRPPRERRGRSRRGWRSLRRRRRKCGASSSSWRRRRSCCRSLRGRRCCWSSSYARCRRSAASRGSCSSRRTSPKSARSKRRWCGKTKSTRGRWRRCEGS